MPELTPDLVIQWDIAQNTKLCFGAASGRHELEQLKKDYLFRSSFHTDPLQMAFMEGERHVVLTILRRLEMTQQDLVPIATKAITEEEANDE